jgi:serine/threonine protein kinase/tetratricopeptide (TPR) repeat protein/TolB-like protein
MIGKRLEHYLILNQLGAGGMGVVYCALDEKLDRKVALKVLATGILADEAARRQFHKEALALAKLNHPNIETIYEFCSQDGLDFLVMELMTGVSLSEKLKNGPLTEREVLRFGLQLCEGLAAAHAQGVIHRDLKPSNLFITPENRLKILDFGLAGLLKPQEEADIARTLSEEQGRVVGTLPYMSAEQLRGEPVDARTDIYSAGAVLYEMATGSRPFPQSSSVQLIGAILHKAPASLRVFNERFQPGLEAVIMKTLDKEASERYQTARELRTALETLTSSSVSGATNWQTTTAPASGTTTAVVPTKARPWGWIAAGTAAGALALMFGLDTGHVRSSLMGNRNSTEPVSRQGISAPAARRAIAVLSFLNVSKRTDQVWLATTLPEMLTTELGAGGNLRTIAGEDVTRMKSDLGLPDADSYGGETLQRIGKILGAENIVTGSYLAPGTGQVRLDLRLQNAQTGETVDTISVNGKGEQVADLVELIGRAGGQLRQKLGVEGNPPAAESVLKASLPSSPVAAQLYAEGIEKLRRMDAKGAIESLQKATQKAPEYALAHSAMAEAWSLLGYDDRALSEERKALSFAGSLSAEDRGLIQGRLYEFASEWDKAATYYLSLRTLYQDDLDYGLRQANAQVRGGKPKEALATISELRGVPGPAGEDPRIDLRAAEAAEMMGDFKAQEAGAARAAEKAAHQGSRRLAASAEWHRCTALMNLGDAAAAKAACEKARDSARAVDDALLEARSLTGLGYALSDQGDNASALQCHKQALQLVRGIGAQRDIAGALLNIANLTYASGDLKAAHRYYQESLETSRGINNKQGILDAEGGLAADLVASADSAAALRIYEDMLKTARDVGDQKNASFALLGLGLILYEQGDLAGARKRMEEAVKITRDAGMKGDYAAGLNALGDLDLAQDHLENAAKSYRESLQLNQQLEDKSGQASNNAAMAWLALEENRLAEAEALASKAAEAFEAQKNADLETDALGTLARALVEQGKLAEARKAIERAKSLPTQDEGIRLKLAICEAYLAAHDGRTNDATRILTECIQKAADRKWKRSEFEAVLARVEIETQTGAAAAAKALAKRLQSDAKSAGFALIARKAGALAK